MKPAKPWKSTAPIGSPQAIAEYNRWRAEFDRSMLRKVRRWARTWERCPLAGCRRNGRCLRFDDCRGVSGELSEESRLRIRAALHPETSRSPAGPDALAAWVLPAAGRHR